MGYKDVLHDKIDGLELSNALFNRRLERRHVPNVDVADSEDLRSGPYFRDLSGHVLGLFGIPADNASIGPEVHQGPDLGGADSTIASGTENHGPVLFRQKLESCIRIWL